ncbi:LIM/homeobox protein Lhx9-like [Centruroides vittatus]|uniref:LIM/homeobox protein Lhx9-like n=1 Tax=Centruroides vittatus TaxID=120091 RepID=UPI000C6DCCF3|nr:LIM/homeobox protein Lhx9-like isoform X1 [Centruroides sculpturatus]XP_023235078.1 LIM/homeobox protein Lhx9-like isoform X1 [Centruroides sculpturatus]XP_023235079.1 LIM/homeobox protein Lhx9-like isoform X2 [Centruroides sculpturatus]XP_023235080.1 LIM/homeobox protein Lhx9-like isoform X3 [Centruroides sculpturatus]
MPVISVGDYEPPAPNLCAGCGGKIVDRYYLLAVDRQWHIHCLKCCECKLQLDSELTCFARDGNIYCKEDYYRLFAVKRCARCQRGIFANELVMRARDLVYHLHCFTCGWCNAALTQGDYFGLRDNLVYCRTHYELLVHGDSYLTAEGLPRQGPVNGGPPATGSTLGERTTDNPAPPPPYPVYSGVGSVRKGRPRKRKTSDIGVDGLQPQNIGLQVMDPTLHIPQMDGSSNNQNSQTGMSTGQPPQRTKRMRTSFKHHQLRTMKSYFAINQNPDAKDLKQLAQKTGLSKRVLQVWFQNARAKWRRNNLKQQEQQQTQTSQAHPISAGSPGATSSFSEPSPAPSCGGMGAEGPVSTHSIVNMTGIDYGDGGALTPLVSHHAPTSVGGDGLPLTSFQELF